MSATFAEDCKSFIQLHAKHARLKARMDVLSDRIKPKLREGQRSPRDLPYVLVLQERMRTLADWKEALRGQLKAWLRNDQQVIDRMETIQQTFPTRTDEALTVQINKSYAAKL